MTIENYLTVKEVVAHMPVLNARIFHWLHWLPIEEQATHVQADLKESYNRNGGNCGVSAWGCVHQIGGILTWKDDVPENTDTIQRYCYRNFQIGTPSRRGIKRQGEYEN